ncbi:MAG TPA: hypothetical protein VFJ71_12295 [Candidatus Limnocylindrales bacterium]|nr:hypothetical protein [Candidatus Limnocylindrales bacterium]
MERDLSSGSGYGRDELRDLADEAPGALRDAAPDPLAPIDERAPVSGHVPASEGSHAALIAESPEHDWSAASGLIYPLLRPAGTQGLEIASLNADALAADATRSHSQPLVDAGPVGLVVVYAMQGSGFDVIVNGDHLLSWGVPASDVQDAAMRNLADWSNGAPWTDEVSGERRLISSDTGDGWDASRILLPVVCQRLAAELGPSGRVLVGLPERHLMIAGALRPGDEEFAALFADFVVESSGGADEPVDRRVFELIDGRLVEPTGLPAPA